VRSFRNINAPNLGGFAAVHGHVAQRHLRFGIDFERTAKSGRFAVADGATAHGEHRAGTNEDAAPTSGCTKSVSISAAAPGNEHVDKYKVGPRPRIYSTFAAVCNRAAGHLDGAAF
jgi:hypothetical protein